MPFLPLGYGMVIFYCQFYPLLRLILLWLLDQGQAKGYPIHLYPCYVVQVILLIAFLATWSLSWPVKVCLLKCQECLDWKHFLPAYFSKCMVPLTTSLRGVTNRHYHLIWWRRPWKIVLTIEAEAAPMYHTTIKVCVLAKRESNKIMCAAYSYCTSVSLYSVTIWLWTAYYATKITSNNQDTVKLPCFLFCHGNCE